MSHLKWLWQHRLANWSIIYCLVKTALLLNKSNSTGIDYFDGMTWYTIVYDFPVLSENFAVFIEWKWWLKFICFRVPFDFPEHVHSKAHSLDSLLGSIQQDIDRFCQVAHVRHQHRVSPVRLELQSFLLPLELHLFLIRLVGLAGRQDQFHLFQSV